MRRLLLSVFILFSLAAGAQDIFSEMPLVVVHQDTLIRKLLNDRISGRELQETEIQGFRVQIFSSNRQQTAKNDAFAIEKRLQELKLTQPVYVLYNPPFWKVRVGDFRRQEDAQALRDELITLLPDMVGDIYVVKDKIIVLE